MSRKEREDILWEIGQKARAVAKAEAARPATRGNILAPYKPGHVKAQMLMALVVDPETNRPMNRGRVAELCGINRATLWKWINDPSRGGKAAWYAAVERYARSYLEEFIPLLLRALQDEALHGKSRVGAGRLLLQYAGKLRPDIAIDMKTEVTPSSRVVILLPDNGRNPHLTHPDEGSFREGNG